MSKRCWGHIPWFFLCCLFPKVNVAERFFSNINFKTFWCCLYLKNLYVFIYLLLFVIIYGGGQPTLPICHADMSCRSLSGRCHESLRTVAHYQGPTSHMKIIHFAFPLIILPKYFTKFRDSHLRRRRMTECRASKEMFWKICREVL